MRKLALFAVLVLLPRLTAYSRDPGPGSDSLVPKQTDAGWNIVSLAEAGADPRKVAELRCNLQSPSFQKVHGVILVKKLKR